MDTSSSGLVGPFDISAHMSARGEFDKDVARIRESIIGDVQCSLSSMAAQRNLSSVADRVAKEQMQAAASLGAATPEDDNLTRLNIRLPQGAPEARRLLGSAQLLEADAWAPTPLLRRPSDPLATWAKFVIASTTAVLFIGYLAFGNSSRTIDVTLALQPKIDRSTGFLPAQEAETPSAMAKGVTALGRTAPEAQIGSSQPTVRHEIQPTESGIETGPLLKALLERKGFFAANGDESPCFPSASAVLHNYPGARPSWTFRALGHEGTRCWYPATRTMAEGGAPTGKAGGVVVESRTVPDAQTASSQPTVRDEIQLTESGIEPKPPQATFPERGKELVAGSSHDSTCFPSASAVLRNYPVARPSWTLRAPGHEGTRCWFPTGANSPTTIEVR
jgi:hypothetical protein